MPFNTEIENLCALGCNVTINADTYFLESLLKFASLSRNAGGILTIKNSEKLFSSSREKIAAVGKNNVTFDFT